ncbi:hypothetical protein N7G274_003375 [Stereocaulon virgatum]|uniref:Major facilitator superfamily (MFS) profile domain-containing protein n=1 Tax=Stereocaulon virgatum TaxID=373712 RepID=A0ABR4AEH1_9LECA
MGLGIVEPRRRGTHVPGTAVLLQDDLGTKSKGEDEVVLVPRPSDSPRDPLNWPLWKKDLCLFAICLSITLGGIQSAILSTVNGVLLLEFQTSITKVENLSSYPPLACAISCLFASVLARMIGKRPVYLMSTTIFLISTVWCALIGKDYGSFFAARFISGLGLGAYEAIVLSTVGDLYFVHQRGKRIAFLNVMSLGPVNLSPIISGYVADKYGWRTNFWIMTAFTAIALLFIFFAAPETTYNRPVLYETDINSGVSSPITQDTLITDDVATTKENGSNVSPPPKDKERSTEGMDMHEPPRSYWQELSPIRGLETRDNPLVLLIRLFTCALYPAVIWSFLVGGTYVAWFIALTVVVAQIFSPPPISYTPAKLGHLNTFPTVGAFMAFIVMGTLADSTAKYAARRNNRIYEPEFRLYLISFGLFIGVPGLALFGWYASTAAPGHMINWVVMSFIYGMVIFTTVTQQSNTFAYLLDAHRDISVETAVFSVMLRNFFSFGAGKFLPVWLFKSGPAKTFYAIAGIQAALVLTTVPLYVYGKVIREFYHRHNPFKFLHVDVGRRMA